jgi:hypothetical protein
MHGQISLGAIETHQLNVSYVAFSVFLLSFYGVPDSSMLHISMYM